MRILKRGQRQNGWAKKYHCTGNGNGGGGCTSLLLVERDDLFRTTHVHQSDQDHFVSFLCPECGVITNISGSPVAAEELMSFNSWSRKERTRKQKGIASPAKAVDGPAVLNTMGLEQVPHGALEAIYEDKTQKSKAPNGSFNFNGEERRM